ncbi:hypothetical protein EC912_103272 [Luteibacter rhizovicinus]|uniref:Uncharacterized protein n=1 Tax=Luteibacter rhizovicinus TaxID=242606 RepID=A0A4R3YPT8_9GAMM|nr:hypothetical protein [Luteibacter rhizovicinus]TCV94787.1 hypothetical protein EC912_103272 [Luteibacter rhizovicinus]
MSLVLQSSNVALDKFLRALEADGSVSPVDFQAIRDNADRWTDVVDYPELAGTLKAFQGAADTLAETTQKVALAARKGKVKGVELEALKDAIEHQLAYVVAGYKSSVERI